MNLQLDEALERLATITERGLRPAEAVGECAAIYVELGERQAEIEIARQTCKQIVSDVFAELGTDKLEAGGAVCYVSRPSIRIAYDTRGLDKLASERPEIGGILALYRTEREQPGVLTIRVGRN
jgi:hypothetical protein